MPVKRNLFLSGGTQLLICRFMELSVCEIHVFWCKGTMSKMPKVKGRNNINEDDSKVLLELSILSVKIKPTTPFSPFQLPTPKKRFQAAAGYILSESRQAPIYKLMVLQKFTY